MRHQGEQLQRMLRTLRGHGGWLSVWLLAAGWLALPSLGFAAEGAPAGPVEYRDIPGIGSRNIVWVIAQLHLLLAGFVLGVPDLRAFVLMPANRRGIKEDVCPG